MVNKMFFGGVLLLLSISLASAATITFESDSKGFKPNGWSSADSALVTFTDTSGAGLKVDLFGDRSFGKGLAVWNDYDGSELIMNFLVPCNSLTLWFGNDDPGQTNEGDQAVLKLFYGSGAVGQTSVAMNRNNKMDQSIGLSGTVFDKAIFAYKATVHQGGLMEIVDDIEFTPINQPLHTPEASSLALFGVGILGLLGYGRRRRQ